MLIRLHFCTTEMPATCLPECVARQGPEHGSPFCPCGHFLLLLIFSWGARHEGALDIILTGHSGNDFKEKLLGKATAGLQGQSGRGDPGSRASVRTWGFVSLVNTS